MLEDVRVKTSADKMATYTYSADYMSQSFPAISDEDYKKSNAEDRSKWKTDAGFLYPPPKDPKDYNVHPMKPSKFRIDDLMSPFDDEGEIKDYDSSLNELEANFINTSTGQKFAAHSKWLGTNEDGLFGGYNAAEFATDYTSKFVGSRRKLPRGSMNLSKNPGFYASVHLQEGNGPQKSNATEEKYQPFIVDGFCQRDRPSQLARQDDILHGPPIKKSLRIVRNATLPSGKRVPLEATPLTIVNVGPYLDTQGFEKSLRQDDDSKLITAVEGGDGQDFMRYIHYGEFKPRSQTCVYRKKHAPITTKEGNADLWHGSNDT